MERDWAVILARGESSRMGRPKGACRLPDAGGTLLERVLTLYAVVGLPAAVVTTAELVTIYREAAGDGGAAATWVLAPGGAGTAETVRVALLALGDAAHRLWLHPVDLPHVRPSSLAALMRAAEEAPAAVLIPRHAGRRGHPVLLPAAPWRRWTGRPWPGNMRDLLTASQKAPGGPDVRHVDLDDPGLVADIDEPADLAGTGEGPAPPADGGGPRARGDTRS